MHLKTLPKTIGMSLVSTVLLHAAPLTAQTTQTIKKEMGQVQLEITIKLTVPQQSEQSISASPETSSVSTKPTPSTSQNSPSGKGNKGSKGDFEDDGREEEIVGGKDVETGWGSIVSLQPKSYGYQHYCGGTLINSRWVVTAAHCVSPYGDISPGDKVVLGSYNWKKLDGCAETRRVQAIIAHEYNGHSSGDIALIRLDKESKQPPMPLNTAIEVKARDEVQVAGWGQKGDGSYPDRLQEVTLKAKDKLCYGGGVNGEVLCALRPGKDSCGGDSGGPLTIKQGDQQYLAGIVSSGPYPCAHPRQPGRYVRVRHKVQWINDTIRKN